MEKALYNITMTTTNRIGKMISKREPHQPRRFINQLRHIKALKCLKHETILDATKDYFENVLMPKKSKIDDAVVRARQNSPNTKNRRT